MKLPRIVPLLLIMGSLTLHVHAQSITPVPSRPDALSLADDLLRSGDHDSALAQYLSAAANPDLACDALYGAGMTHLRMGMWAEAAQTFTQQMERCGAGLRSLVLRGDARRRLGDNAGAQSDYEAALNLNLGLIDSYLYERIATVNPDASVLYLRLAVEARREPQGEYVLRNELAQIYRLIGRPDEAIIQYDTIVAAGLLSEAQEDDRAAVIVAAATLDIGRGSAQSGYDRLQQVLRDHPDTPAAFDALVALINAGQQVELLTRMRINVANENYNPVVAVLSPYLDSPPEGDAVPAELYLLLGRSQRGLGDPASALSTFQRLRDRYPTDPLASTAALEQGQTYAQANDRVNAIGAYATVAATYPQSQEAPEALLRAARSAQVLGDTSQAIAFYDQLGSQYGGTEEAKEGMFEAAQIMQVIDPARAVDYYGRSGSAHGLLWQGRLLQSFGNVAGAQQAWEAAITAEPGTFFSMRACALLNAIPPYAPSSALRLEDFAPEDIATAEAWMAQTFALPQASAALPPELATNPLLVRGTELWALGFAGEANAEFVALHRLNRDNPLAMFQLAAYYRGIGAYRASINAATRVSVLANRPMPDIPAYIARLAYPIYYPDLVVGTAQTYGLDPLYVTSIIRQESTFDATAMSIAGARGLMQLMPATAADVAGRLGIATYQIDDLFRPRINVELGTAYLASTRDFLSGDAVSALLGYNAGPGRAAQWAEAAQGDIDVLYETIPFEETRLYLEITYRNFAVYRALYGEGMPACMFTVTPSTHS